MNKTIGDRIRYCLDLRHMKQRELAEKTELEEVTISRYVNNLRTPSAGSIVAICRALGVSADWLLGMMEDEK